jgi:hypothetical protein
VQLSAFRCSYAVITGNYLSFLFLEIMINVTMQEIVRAVLTIRLKIFNIFCLTNAARYDIFTTRGGFPPPGVLLSKSFDIT